MKTSNQASRETCFAYRGGKCMVLTENKCKGCKFFKTKRRLLYEQLRSEERLGKLK